MSPSSLGGGPCSTQTPRSVRLSLPSRVSSPIAVVTDGPVRPDQIPQTLVGQRDGHGDTRATHPPEAFGEMP